jgi:DNA primase
MGKAEAEPNKMCLGPVGGGAVWLSEPIGGKPLLIGEGIETTLAAMGWYDLPGWAAVSTSGMRSLRLPAHVQEVVIAADNDEPGEAAAQTTARRWHDEGRRVRIARSPYKKDFADLIAHERGGH